MTSLALLCSISYSESLLLEFMPGFCSCSSEPLAVLLLRMSPYGMSSIIFSNVILTFVYE